MMTVEKADAGRYGGRGDMQNAEAKGIEGGQGVGGGRGRSRSGRGSGLQEMGQGQLVLRMGKHLANFSCPLELIEEGQGSGERVERRASPLAVTNLGTDVLYPGGRLGEALACFQQVLSLLALLGAKVRILTLRRRWMR
jgi:hypothetical protein